MKTVVEITQFNGTSEFEAFLYSIEPSNREQSTVVGRFTSIQSLLNQLTSDIYLLVNINQLFNFSVPKQLNSNREELIRQIQTRFPTITVSEYAIQSYRFEETIYTSMVQQSLLNELLDLFQEVSVRDVFLGPHPVVPLLPSVAQPFPIQITHYQIERANEYMFRKNNEIARDELRLDQLTIKSQLLLALAVCLGSNHRVMNQLGDSIELNNSEEHEKKVQFIRRVIAPLIGLLMLFGIIHFFVEQSNEELSNEYTLKSGAINAYMSLKNQEGFQVSNRDVFASLMIDEVLGVKPKQIISNDIIYSTNDIVINSQIPNQGNHLISQWINSIEQKEWTKDVSLRTYSRSGDSEFQLTITFE